MKDIKPAAGAGAACIRAGGEHFEHML